MSFGGHKDIGEIKTDFNRAITYGGSEEIQVKIKEQLASIASKSPKAAKIIAELENSKHRHHIAPIKYDKQDPVTKTLNLEDSKNGKGSPTEIYYNPESNKVSKNLAGERIEFNPEEVLSHEISHAGDSNRGNNSEIMDKDRKQNQKETNAIIVQNEVSKSDNRKTRTYHSLRREIERRKREDALRSDGRLSSWEYLDDNNYKPNYEKDDDKTK